MVDVPKTKVETRDGRFAKVNYIIPGDDFPLKGVMADYEGRLMEVSWTADGKYLGTVIGLDDLIIVEEKPEYL